MLGSDVVEVAGYEPVAVRSEDGGATARLRGVLEAVVEIHAGETLFTIPAAERPKNKIEVGYGVTTATGRNHVGTLLISPDGTVTDPETPVPVGIYYLLDAITWNLT